MASQTLKNHRGFSNLFLRDFPIYFSLFPSKASIFQKKTQFSYGIFPIFPCDFPIKSRVFLWHPAWVPMATRRHRSIGDRGMPAMRPSVCWSRGACGDDFFRGFNGDRYVIYIYIYIYMSPVPGPPHPPPPPPMVSPPTPNPPTPPKPSICMLFAHIHTHIHIYTPLSTPPPSHLYVICSTWEPRPRQRTLSTCIFLS